MKTKRQLSEQAQVAQLCKQFCKSKGIQCKARSDSFSMGDSVTVRVYDQPPGVRQMLESEFSQYKYGHFDGMTDMYESSNRRHDIPQTKYLSVNNEFSPELKQLAWSFLRSRINGYDQYPELYQDLNSTYIDGSRDHAQNVVWQLLVGSFDYRWCAEFWDSQKSEPIPAKVHTVSNVGGHIEQHEHTKKGFTMYMVILANTVERDEFNELRDTVQSMGGWYSRKWGPTPGGFAFKDMGTAEQFLNTLTGSNTSADEPPKGNSNKADKFRDMADKLQSKIDDCFADRLINTPKRLAQAEHKRVDGLRLERDQKALRALADCWESGTVPSELVNINTKAQIHELTSSVLEPACNGFHSYYVDTNQPRLKTPGAVALWSLLSPRTPEQIKADELKQKLNGLQFSNIPGYFSTPKAVIEQMIDYADIEPHHTILEPSAGHGAIADYVVSLSPERPQIDVCEVNYTLADILKAKGHRVNQGDFMLTEYTHKFDRILMNPPFEKGQDVEHVQRAFTMLADGGVLVAVMSAGAFFNSQRKFEAFREWLGSVGGEVIDLLDGSFKESGTVVSTKLVVIHN